MATREVTHGPSVASSAEQQPRVRRRRLTVEGGAYVVLALAVLALVWLRAREVDAWYNDENLYVHAGEWISAHLPSSLWGPMANWTRGPQRLYPTLLAIPYGLFGASRAYTVAHFMNALLLASAVWPAALLARRVIVHPALRVLGVALGVALPWLMIGNHLLAENLAFPLFLWSCVAILRVTEDPRVGNQALAVAVIGATALTRINLGLLFGALAVAVLVREGLVAYEKAGVPWPRRLAQAARTEWLLVLTFLIVLIVGIHLLRGGVGTLGDYGRTATASGIWGRLFGGSADSTRHSAMTFVRSLVTGMFVFPFALGIGAALAAAAGRLGRSRVVPGVLTLVSLPLVIGGVVLAASVQEERYVFYPAALIALFAAGAVEHVRRLRGWITAGSVIAVWALLVGAAMPGVLNWHFFQAPAGAFWTRVLDARLRAAERDLLGWTLLPQTGWLLFAAGLVVMVLAVRLLAVRHTRLLQGIIAVGLAACAVMQVITMQYSAEQELHGTTTQRGGIALEPGHAERLSFIDAAVPSGATAVIQPHVLGADRPLSLAENAEFWSEKLDDVLAMRWSEAPVPAWTGQGVIETTVGADGLARWSRALPPWLVAVPDDARLQLAARLARRSPRTPFAVWQLQPADRAYWTATGVGIDGTVQAGRPVDMALDVSRSPHPTRVRLAVAALGSSRATYVVERSDGLIRRGRIAGGASRHIDLRVPRRADSVARWTLRTATGLRLTSAHISR